MLGRYRPIRPLGSGSSGSVWLAVEDESGIEVALKIVPREGNAGARAEREASAAAKLRHERCLRAHALARDPGHVYIVYEYVPGRTLREAIREDTLDDAEMLEAGAQILDGLANAHAHGVVHRDVKPANVLLADGPDTSVKLFDFGLAVMHEHETLTAVGDIPGTLAYISPERLRGDAARPAADVWAVGVLLWEALAGRHPFWSGSLLDTARQIEEGAPSLATVRPDLDRAIVECVDRALAVDPRKRPSARALAARLRKVAPALRRSRRRPPRLALAPAAAVRRIVPAGAAVLFTAWSAAALPFFPAGWPLALAALAGVVALWNQRLALAFCLAVPVLPLGNYALGLAVLYAAAALVWLVAVLARPGGRALLDGGAAARVRRAHRRPAGRRARDRQPDPPRHPGGDGGARGGGGGRREQARPPRHRRFRPPGRGRRRGRTGARARDDRPGGRARPRRRRPALRARAGPLGNRRARGVLHGRASCSQRRHSPPLPSSARHG